MQLILVNLLQHPDAASSSPTARPWGRDENCCWCRGGHSTLTVATELVVSVKTTTLITVLRAASGTTNILPVYVREEKWAIVHRVVYGKGSKIECAIVLCTRPLEIEVCERNVLSGSRVRSTLTHPRSETSVLIDLMTKSAKKLVVQGWSGLPKNWIAWY